MSSPTLSQRAMGVLTLKAPVYKDLAHDPAATRQAVNIVILVLIVGAILSGVSGIFAGGILMGLVNAAIFVISVLIAWYIGAWVLAFVAKTFFKAETSAQEMLRVTGFVTLFTLVGAVLGLIGNILPFLLCLVGVAGLVVAIMQFVGYLIGIREAAGFTTGKAIATAIIAAIVVFIINSILASIGIGFAVMTQPK